MKIIKTDMGTTGANSFTTFNVLDPLLQGGMAMVLNCRTKLPS